MISQIPKPIIEIIQKLEAEGFEAYIVGGCVRDLLVENPPAGGPKDWDVTTNAKPEEITKIFPASFYENKFGTVGVKIPKSDQDSIFPLADKSANSSKSNLSEVVEITTYRIESNIPTSGIQTRCDLRKLSRKI